MKDPPAWQFLGVSLVVVLSAPHENCSVYTRSNPRDATVTTSLFGGADSLAAMMLPSAASQQLAKAAGGPAGSPEGAPFWQTGRSATAGTAATPPASSGPCLSAAPEALLPCGLTADELAALTAHVEARSGSGSLGAGRGEGRCSEGSSSSGSRVAALDQPPW